MVWPAGRDEAWSGAVTPPGARSRPAGQLDQPSDRPELPTLYRHLRANFTYDVIPIALFQAPIYVTSGNEALM